MTNEGDNDVPAGDNIPLDPVTQLETFTPQIKQHEEKLAQLEAENAFLRAENASLITQNEDINIDARTRFYTYVNPMKPLDENPITTCITQSTLRRESNVKTWARRTHVFPTSEPVKNR